MKNLFDFATRELSQDAFLRWLLENYNDHELKDAAGDLLQELCGINVKEQTTEGIKEAIINMINETDVDILQPKEISRVIVLLFDKQDEYK